MSHDTVKYPLWDKIILSIENYGSSIMPNTSTWSTVAFIIKGEVGISEVVK